MCETTTHAPIIAGARESAVTQPEAEWPAQPKRTRRKQAA